MMSISACSPGGQDVMPPLSYTGNVTFHDNRTADLYWQLGQQLSAEAPTPESNPQDGIIGAITVSTINSAVRSAHPGDYTFTYGKALQAVFMTSLRDALIEQHAFKQVNLITDLHDAKTQNVLITINFKETHVADTMTGWCIVLDVVLTIKSANQTLFTRTYLVQSTDPGFFSPKSFKQQQTDVSQKLLNNIMNGIAQWEKQRY
ncbi:MAG: hypothetical protein ACK4PR_14405 [Gammaproteobacteria bacterium]